MEIKENFSSLSINNKLQSDNLKAVEKYIDGKNKTLISKLHVLCIITHNNNIFHLLFILFSFS